MRKLFVLLLVVSVSIEISSCSKDNVAPQASITISSKSTTTTGSTPNSTTTAVPIIVNTDLQGSWNIISDSTFWAGESPKYLVSAYKGKTDDSFIFAADGKLFIHEDALSDTTAYAIDSLYNINAIYADAKHFNEAPGFGLELDPVGFDPTIPVNFKQASVNKNVLILVAGMGTPDGAATRVIYLKR